MADPPTGRTPVSIYEQLGGASFFDALAARFYAGVAGDPVLRPLYPKDMTDAEANLRDFLIQFWGGPDDYSRRRGHPMLRARHLPFSIGRQERDAWMRHMAAAVRSSGAPAELATELLDYFERAATHLLNAEPPRPGHLPIVPPPGERRVDD
ncbi:MAG: globin [Acidimicrobiia bacterium]|nr:globin [Acidimicrobiia bacterium]